MRYLLSIILALSLVTVGCPKKGSGRAPAALGNRPTVSVATPPPTAASIDRKIALEVRQDFCDYTDAIEAAQKAGEPDYLGLVAGAMSRDRNSMHRLLRLTARPEFTGQAMTDHADILWVVLCDVGDRFFASCLADNNAIAPAVRLQILANSAGDEKPPYAQALEDLRGTFPKTFPDTFSPPDPNAPKQSSGGYDDGTDDDNPGDDDYPVA
jgi:hypothetical protein